MLRDPPQEVIFVLDGFVRERKANRHNPVVLTISYITHCVIYSQISGSFGNEIKHVAV